MAALAMYAHYNVASTDVICQWNQRQSKIDEVVTISELYPLPTVKQDFQPLYRDISEENRAKFYNELQDYGGAVGFTWLLRVLNMMSFLLSHILSHSELVRKHMKD